MQRRSVLKLICVFRTLNMYIYLLIQMLLLAQVKYMNMIPLENEHYAMTSLAHHAQSQFELVKAKTAKL